MRSAQIMNLIKGVLMLGMDPKLVPMARATVAGGVPLRGEHFTRYPERTSRVKTKGRRDASQRSRNNRRKAAR